MLRRTFLALSGSLALALPEDPASDFDELSASAGPQEREAHALLQWVREPNLGVRYFWLVRDSVVSLFWMWDSPDNLRFGARRDRSVTIDEMSQRLGITLGDEIARNWAMMHMQVVRSIGLNLLGISGEEWRNADVDKLIAIDNAMKELWSSTEPPASPMSAGICGPSWIGHYSAHVGRIVEPTAMSRGW